MNLSSEISWFQAFAFSNSTCNAYAVAKAADAKARMEEAAAASGGVILGDIIPAECNLAELASVRAFAAGWHAAGQPLDVLVLNAGVQYSGRGCHFSPRYFAVKTPVYDSRYGTVCNQSDTRE